MSVENDSQGPHMVLQVLPPRPLSSWVVDADYCVVGEYQCEPWRKGRKLEINVRTVRLANWTVVFLG